MNKETATTLIWVLGAAVALAVALLAVIVVNQRDDGSSVDGEYDIYREIFGLPGDFDPGSFEGSIREYDSFEDAEEEAGYHIPRPADDFVLLDGTVYVETYLRPEDEEAPAVRSAYVSQDGDQLSFQVFPSTYDFVEPRSRGLEKTIGGKEGWIVDEVMRFFAWECGTAASGTDLYCLVLADQDIDDSTYETFVASLR